MTTRPLLLVPVAAALAACGAAPPRPAAPPVSAAAPRPAPAPPPAPPWTHGAPPPPLAPVATRAPASRELTLANGLRIVAVEHHRRPVVTIALLLPRGSLADPPRVGGATVLAVALATDFHERTDAGVPIVDEKSLRKQVYELGGHLSFDVDHDHSALEITGYAQDAKEYLALLADAVIRPRRGGESFSARRDMLLDAIEDLETSDPAALERVVSEAAFGAGHPYARSLLGTKASLEPIGLEDIVAQQDLVIRPTGATLLVVGDVRPDAILASARAAFGRWTAEAPAPAPPSVAAAPPAPARREVGLLRRVPASTLLVCAARPLGTARDDAAVEVLAALLGGGSQGRLVTALREASGVAYTVSVDVVRRRWAQALLACAVVGGDEAELGVRLLRDTLQSARTTPPSPAELERARAVRLAALEAAHDDALASARTWAEAIVRGEGRPALEARRAALARVTAEDVRAAAGRLLAPDGLRWIVSGDPAVAGRAVAASGLGPLRTLALQR